MTRSRMFRARSAPRSGVRYSQLLQVRGFRYAYAAQAISVTGDQVSRVALAALAFSVTRSAVWAAAAVALTFLPWLVGGPLLGLLADRRPRRAIMVTADVLRAGLVGLAAIPALPLPAAFSCLGLAALLSAAFETARAAAMPQVVPEKLYVSAQSLSVVTVQLLQAAGFALGGVLVALLAPRGALLIDAASFALSAALLRLGFPRLPAATVPADAAEWWRDLTAGARLVGRTPILRQLLGVCLVVAAVAVVPEGLAVPAASGLHGSTRTAGLLAAAVPAGVVIGGLLIGRVAVAARRLRLVLPLGMLSAGAAAASLVASGVLPTLVDWVLIGLGLACQIPANAHFVQSIPNSARGRAVAVAQLLLQVAQGAAILAGGLLADRLGARAAVGIIGVAGLAGLLVLGARLRPLLDGTGAQLRPLLDGASVRRRLGRGAPVIALAVGTIVAAVLAWLRLPAPFAAVPGPLRLPWWSLAPVVLAAQAMLVHFPLRRQARSVSLVHLPIVLGLQTCAPAGLVLARVIGGAAAMLAVRGQRGVKLLLNTASYAAEIVMVLTVFAAVNAVAPPAWWRLWLATYLALAAGDVTSFAIVTGAIALYEHRLRLAEALVPLRFLLVVNVTATSLALLLTAALWRTPFFLVLVAAAVALSLVGYRAHSALRERYLALRELHRFAVDLPPLTPGDPQLAAVLGTVRELFVAERVELHLPAAGHRLVVVASGARTVPLAPDPLPFVVEPHAGWWAEMRGGGVPVLLTSLETADGESAVLTVHHRVGQVRGYQRVDQRQLDSLAALLSGAFARGELQRQVLDAARHDPLTGLLLLPEACRRANELLGEGKRLAAAIVDVIGLERVNESLGHDAGDALLRELARRLTDAQPAVCGRVGGDELVAFVVVDDVTSGESARPAESACAVAAVLDGLDRPIPVGALDLPVGVRSGWADSGQRAEELLAHARAALADAARAAATSRRWSPLLVRGSERPLQIAAALSDAISAGTIGPVFQPLFRLPDAMLVGAEALARWNDPALGPVAPDEFIPVAEQLGRIRDLTTHILDVSLRRVGLWRDAGIPIRVSVNLSARELDEEDLVASVQAALHRHSLPPSALLLEITETAVARDPERALATLRQLRDAGIALALDDFGTGQSSLAALRQLPVTEVKLDRQFLVGLADDETTAGFVGSVVALAKQLDLVVVAEGVEDAETLERLTDLGVDVVQGYHLGRPLAAENWPAGWLAGVPSRDAELAKPRAA